jgi:hypothetical protein
MDKQKCTAKSKQSGERCQRYCSPGASVCFIHGGGAPQVRAAAHHRTAAAEAEAAVERWALPTHISAREALADELARSKGYVDAYDALVQQLGADGVIADGQPTPLVRLLMEERRHYREVGRAAAAVGLDEAQEAAMRTQATLINRALRETIAHVLSVTGGSLTIAQNDQLRQLVAGTLRQISTEIAAIEAKSTPALASASARERGK